MRTRAEIRRTGVTRSGITLTPMCQAARANKCDRIDPTDGSNEQHRLRQASPVPSRRPGVAAPPARRAADESIGSSLPPAGKPIQPIKLSHNGISQQEWDPIPRRHDRAPATPTLLIPSGWRWAADLASGRESLQSPAPRLTITPPPHQQTDPRPDVRTRWASPRGLPLVGFQIAAGRYHTYCRLRVGSQYAISRISRFCSESDDGLG
jgi:hypothetical protein